MLHDGAGRVARRDDIQRQNGELVSTRGRRAKKKRSRKILEALRKDLGESKNLFVTGYEKLRVDQDFELRKTIRAAGGKYKVVKNNIAELAAEGPPTRRNVLKNLRGMTSLAYTSGDPVALAKALTAYAKANPSFTFKAGLVEGRAIDVKAIGELATMPSKEQIYAKLLFPDQCASTATGNGSGSGGPQPGGGRGSRRQGKQV